MSREKKLTKQEQELATNPEFGMIAAGEISVFHIESLQKVDESMFRKVERLLKAGSEVRVSISPRDLNRKKLGATQKDVEVKKLSNALTLDDEQKQIDPVSGTLVLKMNSRDQFDVVLYLGDGHHRMAVNLIQGESTKVKIVATWDQTRGEPKPTKLENSVTLGFNTMLRKVRELLASDKQ
jgi:hypothetical protein